MYFTVYQLYKYQVFSLYGKCADSSIAQRYKLYI